MVGYAPNRCEIERVKNIKTPLTKIFAIRNLIRAFAVALTDYFLDFHEATLKKTMYEMNREVCGK